MELPEGDLLGAEADKMTWPTVIPAARAATAAAAISPIRHLRHRRAAGSGDDEAAKLRGQAVTGDNPPSAGRPTDGPVGPVLKSPFLFVGGEQITVAVDDLPVAVDAAVNLSGAQRHCLFIAVDQSGQTLKLHSEREVSSSAGG